MSQFKKIENYYAQFNEWERLITPAGALEFELTLQFLKKVLFKKSRILDLGGGPGRYTQALLRLGHQVTLGDLSQDLLSQAQHHLKNETNPPDEIVQVNALDLSHFENERFDFVLCLGPFYHLTQANERIKAMSEIHRVLKPQGQICAAFLPYLTGIQSMIFRAAHSTQINSQVLSQVIETGIFESASKQGFQEGIFLDPDEFKNMFEGKGFKTRSIRSVKGFAAGQETDLLSLKNEKPTLYKDFIKAIETTVETNEAIGLGGHALYIGNKNEN